MQETGDEISRGGGGGGVQPITFIETSDGVSALVFDAPGYMAGQC